MSSRLSLCAGVEAPARVEPSSEAARSRARERESSKEHVLPFCACAEHVRVHAVPAMRAAHLDKSALACPQASLCKRFPAGHCGSFFRGQEETTMAMSRQNQFVAVFYISVLPVIQLLTGSVILRT